MPKDSLPTKAEFLADLVTGHAGLTQSMATVQRSHRFPLHLFTQIENLAKMGGVPASLIINQLIDIGLESVLKALPEKTAVEVKRMTSEQVNRPMVTDSVEVKAKKPALKAKPARAK